MSHSHCRGLCTAVAAVHLTLPLPALMLLVQEYLAAIKGVGVYRANSGPLDEPRWEYYNAGKPSQQ